MRRSLSIHQRQRVRRVDTVLLRRIALCLLREHLCVPQFELGIHLVASLEMARVNKNFLQHEGSTDVITFDYSNPEFRVPGSGFRVGERKGPAGASDHELEAGFHGEIFICLDDAVVQAREFRTTWQSELIRYVIHGLLHLRGYEDLKAAARLRMKREENRLLREMARRFDVSELETRNSKRRPRPSPLRTPHSAL